MVLSVDAGTVLTDKGGQRLGLEEVLRGLVVDGIVYGEQAQTLISTRRKLGDKTGDDEHPLALIASRQWSSADTPSHILTEERLMRWLADRVKLAYYRIDPLKIDTTAVTSLISYPYAARYHILPVAVDDEKILVATAQPFSRDWEKELAPLLRRDIERVVANPSEIDRFLKEFYSVSRSIRGANTTGSDALQGVLNLEQLIELGKTDKLDADDRHVVNLVDWLLQYAFEQRASDIHLEPRRESGNIRFRIDGALHLVNEIPPVVMAAVTSRIKVIGRMDLVERRRPQDGRLKTRSPSGQEIELRLSTMPTAFGEKMVLRIFDPSVVQSGFGQLGLTRHDTERWENMLSQPNGMILVTGPTGSGKTTTLYTAMRKLATPEVNVCTIEDPIEMVESSFNQMQVNPGIGVDFAVGVRNLLRQDPDIIMVGEIRDLETAEMAIQASLTGHIVLSTLHTNDAPSAITRSLDIGVPPYLINAVLLGVVAQRLVRTLCTYCKKSINQDEVDWVGLTPPKVSSKSLKFYKPVGCDECHHTGFRGRIGIYEILKMTPQLQELVVPNVDTAKLRKQALKDGMRSLGEMGAQKVCTGLTTAQEVRRVVPGIHFEN
ncbi:MAG: type II/IV secretion system protein [Gammaproteobacteria bacterium]|nr:type II/IV secretion system protein [Gammaproteobacteria bacterium]